MKEDGSGNKTYYVRDAGGTLLSVYTATGAQTPQQQEVMLYGSGRLGMAYKNAGNYEYMYEVKDHLGTVRAVFTAVPGSSIATTDVADYYPFGLRMRGNLNSYRFGYQSLSRSCIGREYAEDETEETGWNSFEARSYDPVIGRWLSVDPARQHFSPYLSMGNNPISRVDPDGRVDDDIYHNTKTGETKIVETNRADRLFIDGKFASQYATDGAWKFMSFDNVTMFADHGSYLYDKFGSGLLNDNLYASLMESTSSLDMQMQISNARGSAFMNRAVAIPAVSVGLPLVIIGGGELIALAPAISGGLSSIGNAANTAYWNAGAAYNYVNIVGSHGARLGAYSAAYHFKDILLAKGYPRFFRRTFVELIHFNKHGTVDVKEIAKPVVETFILPAGSQFVD